MHTAQHFWNDKFDQEDYLYGLEPNAYIESKSHLLPHNANILCLAEGEGRNALHLAKLGHSISAIDASNIAMTKLEKLLNAHGHSVNVETQDLMHWQPLQATFDGVITSYLHTPKPLLAKVLHNSIATLKQDAFFIGEFFSTNQLHYNSGGPRALELLYTIEDFYNHEAKEQINFIELKEEIVHLNEGKGHQGEANVIRVLFQKI